MPRTPHPSLKTYEAFLDGMAKESDETKRYFYQQILWAEKERERHNLKAKKRRGHLRSLVEKDKAAPAAAATPAAE
jgi:hypothetical protein